MQEEVGTEVEGAHQFVGSDRDVDSGHQTVDVWQGEDVGVECDEDHDYVEAAAAAAVGVEVAVAVAVEKNTAAEGPSFVSHAGTQAAAGPRSAVGVEEHTVADSQRTVDTGCTAVEVVVAEVGPQVVEADTVVAEDDYVSSACPDHHNHSLHTKHFVQEVVLEAAEEQTMLECKLESPVAVVAAAGLPLPNKRNNLEVQQAVDLEEVVVAAGCMLVAV